MTGIRGSLVHVMSLDRNHNPVGQTYYSLPAFCYGALRDAEVVRAGGFCDGGGAVLDDETVGSAVYALNDGVHLLRQKKTGRLFAVYRDQDGRGRLPACQDALAAKKKQGGQKEAACQK